MAKKSTDNNEMLYKSKSEKKADILNNIKHVEKLAYHAAIRGDITRQAEYEYCSMRDQAIIHLYYSDRSDRYDC